MSVQVEVIHFVPASQVWPNSRGKAGHNHLIVREAFTSGRLTREAGAVLCGRARGWMERPPDEHDRLRCPKCMELAERHGIEWPGHGNGS